MAWNDTPPTQGELAQTASATPPAQDWSATPPSQQELSGTASASPVDPQVADLLKVFNPQDYEKLSSEQKQQFQSGFNKQQGNFQEALGRGVQQGAGLPFQAASFVNENLSPAALSSSFEKNVVAPIGDALTGNDTSELYNKLSPAQMQAQYNQQIQSGINKDKVAGAVGNMIGSLPSYALAGGAAGAAAKGVGTALGTGAELTGEAANSLTTGQKLGQAAINVPTQAVATGATAATQGYNENPNASPQERQAAALKAGLIGTALGGAGAAVSEVPGVISSLGKNSSNKVLANASLGAEGVNTATAAGRQAITAKGEELAGRVAAGITNLNDTLGKQAAGEIQDIFSSTAKNAQTNVEDIVNQVAGNLDTIGKTNGQAAIDTINNSFSEALKQTGEQAGLTGAKLTAFIQDGLNKYGPVISKELSTAAQAGTTIPVDENFLKTFMAIKNAKVSLPGSESVQNNLWKNWADTLYDTSSNTVKQSAGKIPGGTPISEVSVEGKGVLPSQLPAPQAQPEFVPGAQGQQPTQLPASAPQAATSATEAPPVAPSAPTQPGVNAPLNITTPGAAKTTAGQFDGQPYSSQSGTQVNQTFTPKATIPVDEAKQLAGAMGAASGTPEIGYMAGDLSSQLRKGLQTTLGPDYADATAKYANLKSALEEMGVAKIDASKVTADNITPEGINTFVKKAAQMADTGNTDALDRVYGHLNEVDPTFAANFKSEVDAVSRQRAILAKAQNAQPLQKAAVLQQQGLATPEVNQAATTLQNQGQVQSKIGTTPEQIRKFVSGLTPQDVGSKADLDRILGVLDQVSPETSAMLRSEGTQNAVNQNNTLAAGANQSPLDQFNTLKSAGVNSEAAQQAADNLKKLDLVNKGIGGTNDLGMPSDKTRDFIKNFGKSTDTPNGSATAADTQAIIQKLAGIDPTLAAAVESEAPTVGRQLRAIDYSQSGSGMGSNVVTKALGGVGAAAAKGANLVGQGSRILTSASPAGKLGAAAATSVANKSNGGADDLLKLANVIQNTPEQLGQFAEPLKAAAARGSDALAAMNYALYNSDPKYRDMMNPWQAVTQHTK